MDFISKLRTVRAIERTARQYGYHADATLEDRDVPQLGTLAEELALIAVGLDSGVRLNHMNTKDAAWTRERLRSAVLGKSCRNSGNPAVSPNPAERDSATSPNVSAKIEREWRRRT
ncbi:MAG: hypothetical protein U0805_21090 [Pirellulales bacterium]